MEVLEVKVTLLRSNPALIRQFTVSGERSLKDVCIILKTLLGWEKPVNISLGDGKKTIASETKVKDAFQEQDWLFLNFVEKSSSAQKWTFRVVFLGTRQQEADYPRVIRYRGFNLPEGLESTRDFNRLQKVWSGSGFQFYSLYFTKFPKEKYMFSIGRGNLLLKQKFSEAEKAGNPKEHVELDYEDAVDAAMILSGKTVAELHHVGEICGIPKPKGLRKAELLAFYSQKLSEPYALATVLDSMTLNQYRALKKLCVDKDAPNEDGAMNEVLILLKQCGYADCFVIWSDASIDRSRQLLLAYEQWLDQTEEKEYLRLALLRSTIVGCVRLYGCLKEDYWKEIAPKITGKVYTDQELNEAWAAVCFKTFLNDIGIEAPDCLYSTENLDVGNARKLLERQPSWGNYIPRISEIRQLETGGLRYSDRLGTELERTLVRELMLDKKEAHVAHAAIYRSFQYGQDPDDYAEWLVKKFHHGGAKGRTALKKLFAVLKPNTRQVVYGGYTQNEMERR